MGIMDNFQICKSVLHIYWHSLIVLDFSIDAGKLELETAPFRPKAIFDVMDMLSPLAAQKHINMAILLC